MVPAQHRAALEIVSHMSEAVCRFLVDTMADFEDVHGLPFAVCLDLVHRFGNIITTPCQLIGDVGVIPA